MRALLLLPFLISTHSELASEPDPCPAGSPAWIELSSLPDSLMVPPQFFFDQPTVPLEAVIICAHGVFFNLHAPQDRTSREYFISFPVPTREEYRRFVPPDTMLSTRAAMNPKYIDDYVDRQLAAGTKRYERLRADMQRVLGERYVEGRRIDVTNAKAQMRLRRPIKVLWGKDEIPVETFPGIYWRR